MFKLARLFIMISLFLFTSIHGLVWAEELIVTGQKATENFRTGYRIQFDKNNGEIIAVFDMTTTADDGMLTGLPEYIDHLDINKNGIEIEDYNLVQSYVDINNVKGDMNYIHIDTIILVAR